MTRSAYQVAATLLIGASTVLALAGCSFESKAESTLAPTFSSAPTRLFATEEEAIAAAKALYDEYSLVSDSIARGEFESSAITPFVTAEEYVREEEGFRAFRDKRLRLAGETVSYGFAAQDVDLTAGAISFYICLDVSASRVLNDSGDDVTPPGRGDKQPVLVDAITQGGRLLIDSHESWSGDNFC